jgi:YD repeat-containing protein
MVSMQRHMSPTPTSVNVLASAQNAQYSEIGYCGAEDSPYDVGVYSDMELNGVQTGARAHTGSTSSMINTGGHGFTLTSMDPKGRTYRVSVWSSRPNSKLSYKVNSGTTVPMTVVQRGTSTDRAGNIWYLLESEFNAQESWTNVSVWCEAVGGQTYFDDFRVAPADASMNAYVYDNWGQLTHILDNNNLYTRFQYDAVGRLIFTYQETLGQGGEVPVSQQIYHYAPQ